MSLRRGLPFGLGCSLLLGAAALAQPVAGPTSADPPVAAGPRAPAVTAPPEELRKLTQQFEYGRFRESLDAANALIERGSLAENDLLTAHRIAALSAFNINDLEQAARHFEAVLRIDPDFSLDPFSVPPPTLAFLDKIRTRLAPELARIRQERALRAQQLRQEAEERALAERERELERRRLEDLTRRTVQRVDHHSYIANFGPFGIGQFEEGRNRWGLTFAVSEGLLAGASAVAFWVYQLGVLNTQTYTFPDRLPPHQLTAQGITPAGMNQARFWTALKYYSGGAFFLVYAAGVVDSLEHYQEQSVSTVVQDNPVTPEPTLKPHTQLYLLPGGAGAGLSWRF